MNIHSFKFQGIRILDPKIYHFGIWIVLNWRQSTLRIWIRGLLRKRANTRDNLYLNDLSGGQDKHLITKHLLKCPVNALLPSEAPGPVPYLSSEWHMNFNWPHLPLGLIFLWDSCTNYFFSPVNLSYIILIFRPAKA